MLKKKKRRSKDRLTLTETVRTSEGADEAAVAEWIADVRPVGNTFGGLDWHLRNLEEIWQPHASPALSPDRPTPHSLAWYADQILSWIAIARQQAASPEIDEVRGAALTALRIGSLDEEGRWRPQLVTANNYLRKVRANRLRAGRRRGRDLQADTARLDQQVIDLARRRRAHVPYGRDPEHSTRWLAGEIAKRLKRPFGTIYRRLSALGLR